MKRPRDKTERAVGVTRTCSKCGAPKPPGDFSRGQRCCKDCQRARDKAYRGTESGFILDLAKKCKQHTKDRNAKGRGHAPSEVTAELIQAMREQQEGRCAISRIPLVFAQLSDWKASIDRIDDEVGYVVSNVRIVAAEFNTPAKWSRELLLRAIAARTTPVPADELATTVAALEAPSGPRGGHSSKPLERTTINGVPHVECRGCGTHKPRDHFTNQLGKGCKTCQKKRKSAKRGTWRVVLQELVYKARLHTNDRNETRPDRKLECTVTYDDVVRLYKEQEGRCAYSGVALGLEPGPFKVSLERRDPRVGYVVDFKNVCLVGQGFNGTDMTARKGAEEGERSAGWTREKWEVVSSLMTT